jgi:broad specificity phosphatase PhoE
MTTFFICRHGQTENNKNQRLSGWIDTPLTDTGILNSNASAAKLAGAHFDAVIASDLGRAFITAYLITRKIGYSADILPNKGLREVNYGDLGNMPLDAHPKLSPLQNADFVHPNGESLAQMQQRVLACLDAISRQNPDKTVLLVAHDGTINAINANFSQRNIGLVDAESANGHDFVAKFTYDTGRISSFTEVMA